MFSTTQTSYIMEFVRNSSPRVLAILALCLGFLLYDLTLFLLDKRRHALIRRKEGCKPVKRYKHREPIFGLDVFTQEFKATKYGRLLECLQQRYQKMECYTFSMIWLGERVINTAEPENIEAILETQFGDFEPARQESNQSERQANLYHEEKGCLGEFASTCNEMKLPTEILEILIATRMTTPIILDWLFLTLEQRPEMLRRLRAEFATLGEKSPTFEEVRSLKYLEYCLNEARRLHPSLPSRCHVAVKDTTLPLGGGPDGKSPILVKEGTEVHFHIGVMHRREDLYGKDAAEFKPERWETLSTSTRVHLCDAL